jgi:hypothetical protein
MSDLFKTYDVRVKIVQKEQKSEDVIKGISATNKKVAELIAEDLCKNTLETLGRPIDFVYKLEFKAEERNSVHPNQEEQNG